MAGDVRLIIDYENGNIKSVTTETEKEFEKAGKKAGSNFASDFNKEAGKQIGTIAKTLGAAIAAIGTVTVFKSIGLAREQEDAVNRIGGALRASGEFSQSAVDDFQAYASELQSVSKIGDEVALGQLALAKGFGATNEQAKEIVSAAADLSVALGIDLQSATRNVAKTLGGYAGELGEVIPELKGLTQEQLRSGQAIDLIAGKFQGLAQNELNTFSGALAQTGNSFGDFLEKVGSIVTQNPFIIKSFNTLTGIFQDLGKQVESFAKTFDIFTDVLEPLIAFNEAIITYVVSPLELVANVGVVVFDAINAGAARIVSSFANLGFVIAKVLDLAGVGEGVSQALKDIEQITEKTADSLAMKVGESVTTALDFPLAETLATKNEDLRLYFQEQRDIIAEEALATQEITQAQIAQATEQTTTFADLLIDTFAGVSIGINKTKEEMAKVAAQTANIVRNGLARGISGGIQNIVNNLVNGQNAFKDFGKFVLQTFGDLAIQLGQFFIAEGIAVEALNAVSGTGAIAAGAALIALGSLLKSFAGSGGASAGGSGAGSSPANPAFTSNVSPTGEFVNEGAAQSTPQTVLNINVEGNIRDDESFTRQLVEDISREGGKQGLVFNNLQTA